MARKARIEYEGAVYHVINRGNYRSDIFAQERTREAFLKCLDEAVVKAGWVVHAWCVMSNHYHLCLETPRANLVAGMQWLQSTFSIRFNRLRNERGHLFQGRYKALPIDSDAVGAVCHYIHLNPVRAGVRSLEMIAEWRWSSVAWLMKPRARRSWFSVEACLGHAGGLKDTVSDRKRYLEYLGWLEEDDAGKKALGFDKMSKGWAVGDVGFKKVLLRTCEERQSALILRGDGELAEGLWEEQMLACLVALQKSEYDVQAAPKGARWKVALAATLKERTTVSNPWLAKRLNMGSPFRLSRLVSDCRMSRQRYEPFAEQCAKCKA